MVWYNVWSHSYVFILMAVLVTIRKYIPLFSRPVESARVRKRGGGGDYKNQIEDRKLLKKKK